MNDVIQLERRASSTLGKHEGESSLALSDRLDRTHDNSQTQLPTDHNYAVPTREYQTDQSSLKSAQAAARSVLGKRQRQLQKQPHRSLGVDTVTPYQPNHEVGFYNKRTIDVRKRASIHLFVFPFRVESSVMPHRYADPASVNPGRVLSSFARLRPGQCARGVPGEWPLRRKAIGRVASPAQSCRPQ
jgi:hypothetical protein